MVNISIDPSGTQMLARVEYELTEFGSSLAPILLTMRDWGEKFQKSLQTSTPEVAGKP